MDKFNHDSQRNMPLPLIIEQPRHHQTQQRTQTLATAVDNIMAHGGNHHDIRLQVVVDALIHRLHLGAAHLGCLLQRVFAWRIHSSCIVGGAARASSARAMVGASPAVMIYDMSVIS